MLQQQCGLLKLPSTDLQSSYKRKMNPIANKYDALLEEEGGTQSILDHYASIIELKKSEAKINLLISLEETEEEEKKELEAMKENIDTALKEQISALREKEKKINAYPLSVDLLTASDIGKLAKCFILEDRKWKNSVIQEVDVEQQTAKIKRYGTNEVIELQAYLLKVLKQPDEELFKEGTHCKAIYSGDGEFYPCVIEKVLEEGYLVKYKKYNTQQIVKLHRLRPMGNPSEKQEQIKVADPSDQFKVPDKLKIMPNDPENVKKNKKNKIKALKFAHKNAQVQEINKEKQQKWKDWNSGSNAGQKAGYFKTKYDWEVFQHNKEKS